jgi:transposase
MKLRIRYIGLDVHKDSIAVAVADSGNAPAQLLRTLPNDFVALAKCLDRLGSRAQLSVCYEAGPTGYDLARRLHDAGIRCTVVAPSLVPQDGRRIKTDRRDARKLAHFLRSGDLTAVTVPDRTTFRCLPMPSDAFRCLRASAHHRRTVSEAQRIL